MMQPSEHCLKLYELSLELLVSLVLKEKQRTPPDAVAMLCMLTLRVSALVSSLLILIVMS